MFFGATQQPHRCQVATSGSISPDHSQPPRSKSRDLDLGLGWALGTMLQHATDSWVFFRLHVRGSFYGIHDGRWPGPKPELE